MNLPSIATLARNFTWLDDAQVKKVRQALEKHRHKPGHALRTVDPLMEGFGVECLSSRQGDVEYVNVGESYCATLLFDYKTRTYRVTSVGDLIENNRRFD